MRRMFEDGEDRQTDGLKPWRVQCGTVVPSGDNSRCLVNPHRFHSLIHSFIHSFPVPKDACGMSSRAPSLSPRSRQGRRVSGIRARAAPAIGAQTTRCGARGASGLREGRASSERNS